MPQTTTIPFPDQVIGQGYNTATGAAIGTALNVDAVSADTSADGQASFTQFEFATSQDSLYENLGIQASADVRYGLFDASGKLTFCDQRSVNTLATYIAGGASLRTQHATGRASV